MPRRLLTVLLVLGLLPFIWLRDPPRPPNRSQSVTLTALPLPRASQLGPLRLTGAWHLTSVNTAFGGFSALILPRPGQMTAFSDGGMRLDMPLPGQSGAVRITDLVAKDATLKAARDIEAATFDPATGQMWLTLEGRNVFMRLADPAARPAVIAAPELAGWAQNSGAEAMTRLADGRFLVLAEDGSGSHEGRLLPRAPDGQDRAMRFRFVGPDGFRPTDLAQLPDGRVLILLRELRWPMPPRFGTRLILADPSAIRPGKEWRGVVLGGLDGSGLEDNYEGLAIAAGPGDRVTAWVMSDDNSAATQRTLLLRLEFRLSDLPPRSRCTRAAGKAKGARQTGRPCLVQRRPRGPAANQAA